MIAISSSVRTVNSRRGRRILGLALALIALSLGSVTPAAAITGRTLVTATSANTSSSKSVTATCPAGKEVVGAGGEIVSGLGHVMLTDVTPNAALTSVTAWGGENGTYAGNWKVKAFAICLGIGSIPNLQRIRATAPNNGTSDSSKSADAVCPLGTRLYGTGYETNGANGNAAMWRLRPDAGLTRVETSASETNAFAGVWDWTAYAICGSPRATMTRVSATSTFDSSPVHGIMTNACPTGTTLTGLGAYSEGALSNVHIDRLDPSFLFASSLAAVNGWEDPVTGFGASWDEQAFSICVS